MTEQEKQEIKQEVLNAIKSESQGVTELEEVSSLDGVKTLPALRGTELVSAPVHWQRKQQQKEQPATPTPQPAMPMQRHRRRKQRHKRPRMRKKRRSKPRKQPKQWWNSMRAWQCWRGTAPPPALPAYWMT